MDALVIDVQGAYIGACFFAILPFVVLLAAKVLHYFGIEKNNVPKGKPFYVLFSVGLAFYFALIWMWLFHDQFYQLVPQENGEWQLVYEMPRRTTTIDSATIEEIRPGWGGKAYTRVVINMQDGTRYKSAQMSRFHLKETIDALNALR